MSFEHTDGYTIDHEGDELRFTLSQVVVLLCRGMSASTAFRESISTMQCMNILLQRHVSRS